MVQGVLGGLSSLVWSPVAGATERGLGGVVSGFGKGLAGAVTLPAAGTLGLLSGAAGAVRGLADWVTFGEDGEINEADVSESDKEVSTQSVQVSHVFDTRGDYLCSYRTTCVIQSEDGSVGSTKEYVGGTGSSDVPGPSRSADEVKSHGGSYLMTLSRSC